MTTAAQERTGAKAYAGIEAEKRQLEAHIEEARGGRDERQREVDQLRAGRQGALAAAKREGGLAPARDALNEAERVLADAEDLLAGLLKDQSELELRWRGARIAALLEEQRALDERRDEVQAQFRDQEAQIETLHRKNGELGATIMNLVTRRGQIEIEVQSLRKANG